MSIGPHSIHPVTLFCYHSAFDSCECENVATQFSKGNSIRYAPNNNGYQGGVFELDKKGC